MRARRAAIDETPSLKLMVTRLQELISKELFFLAIVRVSDNFSHGVTLLSLPDVVTTSSPSEVLPARWEPLCTKARSKSEMIRI